MHTPAPWTAETSHAYYSYVMVRGRVLANGKHLAVLVDYDDTPSTPYAGNAHLMAAAPELVAVVQRYVALVNQHADDLAPEAEWEALYALAKAAIDKATIGGPP
jgi:hypothetical protein